MLERSPGPEMGSDYGQDFEKDNLVAGHGHRAPGAERPDSGRPGSDREGRRFEVP